jgi:undecaprenyl-diphosphatase
MNAQLQHLINGWAGHNALLDGAMRAGATYLIAAVGIALIALWWWPAAGPARAANQRVVVAAVVAAAGALLVGALVRALHPEARPFVVDPNTRLLIAHAADSSLPSDHALVSFSVAGTMLWWRRLVGTALVVIGALIGLARISVGVHWPADIAAGALIGMGIGSLAAWAVPWWTGAQRLACRVLPPWLLARP